MIHFAVRAPRAGGGIVIHREEAWSDGVDVPTGAVME